MKHIHELSDNHIKRKTVTRRGRMKYVTIIRGNKSEVKKGLLF